MTANGPAFIDSFSELDNLSQRAKRDPLYLLRALAPKGRFSVFEAAETQPIARAFSALTGRGWMRDVGGQYPWVEFEITDLGRAALAQEQKDG